MKKANDPRHKRRQRLVKHLFAFSFGNLPEPQETAQKIIQDLPTIDEVISINAPEWPITQINKIDLAVLRLAIFELTQTNTPPKVVIDEAVELGKEYGTNSSAKFINGVLGSFLKSKDKKDKTTNHSETKN